MKFFTSLLLSTAVAISTVSAGIYSEINGDVLGRGLPHEVQLPARSNHFLSFARRSEIIENYYRNHPEEEDVSFEVRTGQDAAVKRSDFGVNGAKKMHRRKKSSCSAKKSSSSSSAAPKATAKAASVKTTETKNTSNKSTDSSSSSSSGSYCYNDVISGAMSMDELMSKTPSSFQSLKSTIEAAAKQYQLQPELLVAIAGQESTFCTNISNGYGCMQFSDDGAWAKYGDGKSKWDNGASIWAGAAYLHDLIGQNGGSLYNALRSYNGPIAWGGLPSYQSDVFNKMKGIF